MIFSLVPLVHLNDTLSLIIKLYEKSGYENFEYFSHNILNRFSSEFLAMWFLANLQTDKELKLEVNESVKADTKESFKYEKKLLLKHFSDVDFIEPFGEDNFSKSINAMSKKLWSVEGKDPHYKPKLNRTTFR